FFQAEDGIRDFHVTGVQTCALPICSDGALSRGSADRFDGDSRCPDASGDPREAVLAKRKAVSRRFRQTKHPLWRSAQDQRAAPRSEDRRVGQKWSNMRTV